MKTVYVTKHALTHGIRVGRVHELLAAPKWLGYVKCTVPNSNWRFSYKLGRDCFESEKEANARAVIMVNLKLKSIKRQEARLKQMRDVFKAGAK